ncbi:hypothetical protein SUGI_0579690 [Cryptomeria japonica]|nr:hypothetical protein SUGI_0579690 [Cryptomeria japonica]
MTKTMETTVRDYRVLVADYVASYVDGSIIIPKRGSEEFLSVIGHLERRRDLYKSISEDDLSVMDGGDRVFADISAMASTLAYENKLVIKKRVNQHWKMHFVEFFDFWDDHLQKKSTQAFVVCDKEIDAKLIVVAFRGTQLFEADDYITDLDFSCTLEYVFTTTAVIVKRILWKPPIEISRWCTSYP